MNCQDIVISDVNYYHMSILHNSEIQIRINVSPMKRRKVLYVPCSEVSLWNRKILLSADYKWGFEMSGALLWQISFKRLNICQKYPGISFFKVFRYLIFLNEKW